MCAASEARAGNPCYARRADPPKKQQKSNASSRLRRKRTLHDSGRADAGAAPAELITPPPLWTTKP
jgi:hypothetical protein